MYICICVYVDSICIVLMAFDHRKSRIAISILHIIENTVSSREFTTLVLFYTIHIYTNHIFLLNLFLFINKITSIQIQIEFFSYFWKLIVQEYFYPFSFFILFIWNKKFYQFKIIQRQHYTILLLKYNNRWNNNKIRKLKFINKI